MDERGRAAGAPDHAHQAGLDELFDRQAHFDAQLADMYPPSQGDENSDEAAEMVAPSAKSMRWRILLLIYDLPNYWSSSMLEAAYGWKHQTTSARLTELWQGSFVRRDHKRKNAGGHSEWVYDLEPQVRRLIAERE